MGAYNTLGAAVTWPEVDTYMALFGTAIDDLIAQAPKVNGTVFYVDSVNGGDTSDVGGLSWSDPFASIDYALGHCTANQNDMIVLLPGPTETLTGTQTIDVAGVTILGIGRGQKQAWIKHNHADAEISVTANDVTIANVRFSADVTDVKVAIEIEDGVLNCEVRNCLFDVVTTGTDEFLVSVRTNDASNYAKIKDNVFHMGLGAAVAAISMTKDTDNTEISGNFADGDYSTANINGITTLSTNLRIFDNVLMNGLTGAVGTEPGIELVTGSTGIIWDNYISCDLATKAASIVADACMMFENYYCETVAETGGIIGTASADD